MSAAWEYSMRIQHANTAWEYSLGKQLLYLISAFVVGVLIK